MKIVKKAYPFFLVGFFFVYCGYGYSDEIKNSSVDLNSWYSRSQTVVRVLDKLESKTILLTIAVGSETNYKSLIIKSRKCLVRPASSSTDNAAYLDIISNDSTKKTTFSSWLFSEEPGLSVFENPLYNIKLVGCSGTMKKDLNNSENDDFSSNNMKNNSPTMPSNFDDELEKSLQQSIDNQR